MRPRGWRGSMAKCGCINGCLCGPCARVLMDDLHIIAGLFGGVQYRTLLQELDVTITKMDKIGTMHVGSVSSGEREPPLMFNERASDARIHLDRVLRQVHNMMVHRHPHLDYNRTVDAVAAWLLLFKKTLLEHPQINEIAFGIRKAVSQAQRAIDRPVDKSYLGTCEGSVDGFECGTALYATEKTHDSITCRVCGFNWDVSALRWALTKRLDNALVTAAQVDGWICPDGTEIRKDTIRKWKSRGLIVPVYRDGREWVYRMGDITELARRNHAVT